MRMRRKKRRLSGSGIPVSRGLNQAAAGFIGSAPHYVSGRCGVSPLKWGARKTPTLRLARGEKAFSPDLV